METPDTDRTCVLADRCDDSGLSFKAEVVCPTFDLGVTAQPSVGCGMFGFAGWGSFLSCSK